MFAHIRPRVIGANADDDGAVAAEIARRQLLRRDDAGVQADALQHGRNFIAGAHDVADLELRRQLHVHGLHVFCCGAIGVVRIKIGPRDDLESFGVLLAVVFGARRDLVCAFMQVLRRDLERVIVYVAIMVQIDGDFCWLDLPSLRRFQFQLGVDRTLHVAAHADADLRFACAADRSNDDRRGQQNGDRRADCEWAF